MTGPESRCPHASPGPCAYGRPRGGAGTVASVGKSDSESNWLPQRAGATRSSHKPLGLRWQVMRVTVRWREPAARKGRSCRSGSSSAEPCQCHRAVPTQLPSPPLRVGGLRTRRSWLAAAAGRGASGRAHATRSRARRRQRGRANGARQPPAGPAAAGGPGPSRPGRHARPQRSPLRMSRPRH
jgi:hypothetical protein